jgi:hypothetical protein
MYLIRLVLESLPENFQELDISRLDSGSRAPNWVATIAPSGSQQGFYQLQALANKLKSSGDLVPRFSSPLGAGELNGVRFTGPVGQIRSLISTYQDDAVDALTLQFLEPSQWTRSKLSGWYEEVQQRTVDPSACLAAIDADLSTIDEAIERCRQELRDVARPETAEPSYIGYVVGVVENSSPLGNTLTVQLSHVRKVGDDLDWDGLNSDDPEAVITFGSDGYMDEQYRADNIGESVYKPIFGCGSIVDLGLARTNQDREDEQVEQVQELPPLDASDIRGRLTHPSTCGRDYTDPDTSDTSTAAASTTSSASRALISAYRVLKTTGARSEELFTWLEGIRVRATATPADLYRNMPVLMTRNGSQVEPVDVSRDDDAAYEGDQRLNGFFRSSFLAGDVDYDRVRVLSLQSTGATEEVALTEDEKDLLQELVTRVRAYLNSVSDKTFSRTG